MLPEDPHVQLAADLFNVPVEEVTPEMRSRAKALHFGLNYGADPAILGVRPETAQALRDQYLKMFPEVRP